MAIKRMTDEGEEQLCRSCGEWWPADAEFFYPGFATCKACYLEAKRARREAAKGALAVTP